MKFISVCLLVLCLFLLLIPVYANTEYVFPQASDGQIDEALQKTVPLRFLPSHPLYFLIVVKESSSRFFQPSALKKAQFDFILSGKRLKETYLFLEKGDVKSANRSLIKYAERLAKMNTALERARSQNQDVTTLAAEIAEGLRFHEVLLFAIDKKQRLILDQSASAFVKTVQVINNIMPGVKDRFKTLTNLQKKDENVEASPSPDETTIFESTPSMVPRRIIY